jgi:hypothetical protein
LGFGERMIRGGKQWAFSNGVIATVLNTTQPE